MFAYPLSFAAGLLTALSPCVLPALPFVLGSAAQRRRGAPLALAAGLIVSFVVVGLTLAAAGDAIGLSSDTLRWTASGIMVLAGVLLLVERWHLAMSRWLSPLASRAQSAGGPAGAERGLFGQFLAGALLGAVWSPCVGPTLGAAVGLASQAGGLLPAALMMALFGLGASVPLLFAAYASQHVFMRYRNRLMRQGALGKKMLGGALVLVGIAVMAGLDKSIEAGILSLLPEWWIDITTRF